MIDENLLHLSETSESWGGLPAGRFRPCIIKSLGKISPPNRAFCRAWEGTSSLRTWRQKVNIAERIPRPDKVEVRRIWVTSLVGRRPKGSGGVSAPVALSQPRWGEKRGDTSRESPRCSRTNSRCHDGHVGGINRQSLRPVVPVEIVYVERGS